MKLITRHTETTTIEIDIELPHYFRYDVDVDHSDVTGYGKITEDTEIKIQHANECAYPKETYEIKIEKHCTLKELSYVSDYALTKYNSTKEEYESIKKEMFRFLNGI